MKRSLGGTCGVASGCLAALLSLQGCQAFLCPAATTRMIASGSRRWEVSQKREEFQQDQRQPRRMVTRSISRMVSAGEDARDGKETRRVLRMEGSATKSRREGPLRRVRSLFSRKAATAAAVSALLSAGMPGRADALFGRGKKPEPLPSAPAIERRVEEAVDGLAEASEELVSEGEEALSEPEEGLEDGIISAFGDQEGEEDGDDVNGVIDSFDNDGDSDEQESESLIGSARAEVETVASKDKTRSIKEAFSAARAAVMETKEVAAVAIVGVAGATAVVVSRSGGGGGGDRRRRSGGRAPKSSSAGTGRSRVSPEVAAEAARKKAAKLKKVNFDVDTDLFGDAVSDLPARPPPPAPPAEGPAPSPSDAIQGKAKAARKSAAAAEDLPASGSDAGTSAVTDDPVSASSASSSSAESVEAPEPASITKKQDKPKRKGPMMNLFKRDSGPQRATTMEEAMSGETSDEAVFRQAVASVLAGSAPPGAFDVEEPRRFKEATSQSGDSEKQGEGETAESRVGALKALMQGAGFSTTEGADIVADVVNAMVVRLVDKAVSSRDDTGTAEASDALLAYMDAAGALFEAVCPGVALNPSIKYNGSYKRGKLEKVFEAAARLALKMGEDGQMAKLDRLQDLFSIKEAKANSITQKIMMDLMMKMMSEGGSEDTAGLEKMMEAMGGEGGMPGMGDMGGMPGMGAGRTPEDHKREVEALKAMVDSGECPKEEVDALRKMYTDAGMDIDKLVNDPMMESSMDSDAKEVVVLLRKLLNMWPKK